MAIIWASPWRDEMPLIDLAMWEHIVILWRGFHDMSQATLMKAYQLLSYNTLAGYCQMLRLTPGKIYRVAFTVAVGSYNNLPSLLNGESLQR